MSSPNAVIGNKLNLDKLQEALPYAKSEKSKVIPKTPSDFPRERSPSLNFIEEEKQIAFNPQKSSPYIQPKPNTAKKIPSAELPAFHQGETEFPANDKGSHPLFLSSPTSPDRLDVPDLAASLKINAGGNLLRRDNDKQPVGNAEHGGGFGSEKPLAQPSNTGISTSSGPQPSQNFPLEHRLSYLDNSSMPSESASPISDRISPGITLEQEMESAQNNQQPLMVEDAAFNLKGQINSGVETAFLSLNDQVQQLDVAGGRFSARVTLRPGVNSLKISAIDNSGRYASKGVTVKYTPLDISYSGDWTIYVNDALPENRYIYAVISDHYGNKWFGLDGGVARFNGSSWIKYTVLDGLAGYQVRAIAEDAHGGMWVGTESGVSHFNGSRWVACSYLIHQVENNPPIHQVEKDQECPAGQVNAIACGPDGKVWVGTQNGLFMFNSKTWQHLTQKDGLPHNQVNTLVLDKSGKLWIGTPAGAGMYDGQNWKVFTAREGLSHNTVYAIACDIKDKLWFGTGNGVSCFDGQNWARYTVEDGLSDNQVNAIAIDKANNAWFGTDNGVSRFSKNTWAQFTQANGLASDQVYAIHAESNDRIWFGTSRGVTELTTRYAGHTTHR